LILNLPILPSVAVPHLKEPCLSVIKEIVGSIFSIMIRNTSFFWASDALRNLDEEAENSDDLSEQDEFIEPGQDNDEDISHVGLFLAGEEAASAAADLKNDGMIPRPPSVVDEEAQPLVVQGRKKNGYGSEVALIGSLTDRESRLSSQTQRRMLFPHPEEPRAPSKSPRVTRRKKEIAPQELRFQVV